jgi:hypothetical protein
MSKERELLKECYFYIDNKISVSPKELLIRIEKLLAQSEQATNQDLIDDIEYLITAFEQGADADDYWRPISDLRDDLLALKAQVPIQQGLRELLFRWVDIDVPEYNLLADTKDLLAQPEQERDCPDYEDGPEFVGWEQRSGQQEPVAWMCNLLGNVVTYKPNVNNGYTPLYASPQKREPPQTAREMYQRGYAAAERDLKREPLSAEEIKQTTQGMSEFGADMFKAGVVAAEKAHGIGEKD